MFAFFRFLGGCLRICGLAVVVVVGCDWQLRLRVVPGVYCWRLSGEPCKGTARVFQTSRRTLDCWRFTVPKSVMSRPVAVQVMPCSNLSLAHHWRWRLGARTTSAHASRTIGGCKLPVACGRRHWHQNISIAQWSSRALQDDPWGEVGGFQLFP